MSEVSVRNVSMSYGRVPALDGVSLEVEGGTVFGIIGPDGAGKTTLFRIMTTLLVPGSGEVRVCGCDVRKDFMEIRRMIGYMPGHFSLYQDLTVEENLSLFAAVFNTSIQENYHLVAEIYSQLEPFRKRRAGKLSGGMKQKLALCCAMIHKPRVLFLDEPTTGVDPVSRKEFWQMLARLKAQGITIVVSTPYMDEASKCDVISLMKDGRFFRTDTPEAIVKGFGKRMYELGVQGSIVRALDDVASVQGVESCSPFGDRIHIVSPSLGREELSGRLSAIGYDTSSLREAEPTVEDCFIEFDSRQNE
ncbi:MAG TPA: ABC transporter ATP-binding protein [Candidatus Coprenecus pullicola]|nr:ABC transporter ATP-binding protein [Candidatus Coprenecus pullicola]